ncbi:MAG: TIGR03084 family metal-binding protein [Pseudomonadota bacterium]
MSTNHLHQQNAEAALAAQVRDLHDEGEALHTVLRTLAAADWARVTTFKNWRVWDVVAHLHLSDHMGLRALEGEDRFRALMREMRAHGGSMADFARDWLAGVDGAALCVRWRRDLEALCEGLAATDPEQRLPWVGPGMKPRMFATARQMETWAHGWEVHDLLNLPRHHTDRLRNIATIGVRTFAWSFENRGEPVPGDPPHVRLTAPSGTVWTWNDPAAADRIEGDAVEFCQVVTQVRNVADTRLRVQGEVADRWMAVAQCFAGPPEEPPAPGTRVPNP